jgi:hypothetical protein
VRRIIDLNPFLETKIQKVIQSKKYNDFQQFATVALENQVNLETSNINDSLEEIINESSPSSDPIEIPSINRNESTQAISDFLILADKMKNQKLFQAPARGARVLWGQYYRFLPAKVGARVLYNAYTHDLPDVRDFTDKVTRSAMALKYELIKLDKVDKRRFGELLSASFPSYAPNSVRRFLQHYVIYIRSTDKELFGMLPELKFVNAIQDEDGIFRIGLTEFGKQFAVLENPVLDLGKPESLSKEEVSFLINHIADNIPEEFEHIMTVLKAIKEGKQTRAELNEILKKYYVRYHEGVEWSYTVINTMRSGLMSRLNDLGLIRREKLGKNVRYHITPEGIQHMGI